MHKKTLSAPYSNSLEGSTISGTTGQTGTTGTAAANEKLSVRTAEDEMYSYETAKKQPVVEHIRLRIEPHVENLDVAVDKVGKARANFGYEPVEVGALFPKHDSSAIERRIKELMKDYNQFDHQVSRLESSRQKGFDSYITKYWQWRTQIGVPWTRQDGWRMAPEPDLITPERGFGVPSHTPQQINNWQEEEVVFAEFEKFLERKKHREKEEHKK